VPLISGAFNSDSNTSALKERARVADKKESDGLNWSSGVGEMDVLRLEEAEMDSCLMDCSLKALSSSYVLSKTMRRYV
jgi:hypothetical protein